LIPGIGNPIGGGDLGDGNWDDEDIGNGNFGNGDLGMGNSDNGGWGNDNFGDSTGDMGYDMNYDSLGPTARGGMRNISQSSIRNVFDVQQ